MEKIKQVIVPRKWEALVRVSGSEENWEVWLDEIDFYVLTEDGRILPAVNENGAFVYIVLDNMDDVLEKVMFGITGYPGPLDLRELYADDVKQWFRRNK